MSGGLKPLLNDLTNISQIVCHGANVPFSHAFRFMKRRHSLLSNSGSSGNRLWLHILDVFNITFLLNHTHNIRMLSIYLSIDKLIDVQVASS